MQPRPVTEPTQPRSRVSTTLARLRATQYSLGDPDQAQVLRKNRHLTHELLDALRWTDDLLRLAVTALSQPSEDQLLEAGWDEDWIDIVLDRKELTRLVKRQLKRNRRLTG